MPDTDAFSHESKYLPGLRTALLDERRALDTHTVDSRTRTLLGEVPEQCVADCDPVVVISQAKALL